jgi:hypothetical protein
MKFKIGDKVEVVYDDRGGTAYIGKPGKIIGLNCSEEELKLKNMNIKEQFTLSITPEPQKSFRKVGITNGDNILTDEGLRVFSSWLLNKHAEEFKKDVVDDMVKEMEK